MFEDMFVAAALPSGSWSPKRRVLATGSALHDLSGYAFRTTDKLDSCQVAHACVRIGMQRERTTQRSSVGPSTSGGTESKKGMIRNAAAAANDIMQSRAIDKD